MRGWRYFRCEECGTSWNYVTRDHSSPSCETCPVCVADVHPFDSEADGNISMNNMGEPVIPWKTTKRMFYRHWMEQPDFKDDTPQYEP